MRFLITGGAGFIGSTYARGLIDGHWGLDVESVTVLDSLTYAGNLHNLTTVAGSTKFKFVKGDIRNSALVESLVSDTDILLNFAAESHVDRSISDSKSFIDTNVVGTSTLVMAAIKFKIDKYIQISTDEVYGSIIDGSWDESCNLEPNSPYAASKAAADLVVRGLGNTHELNYNITRCSNNYGPHQFPEKLIPLFITNLIDNLKIPVYGIGKNIREWVHVNDHCAAISLVVKNGKPQNIYNIGGGTGLTNLELTNMILDRFEVSDSFIEFVEDRKNHDLRYSIDDSKLRDELGYQPEIDFQNGLAATIDWYQKNEKWWRQLKTTGKF